MKDIDKAMKLADAYARAHLEFGSDYCRIHTRLALQLFLEKRLESPSVAPQDERAMKEAYALASAAGPESYIDFEDFAAGWRAALSPDSGGK